MSDIVRKVPIQLGKHEPDENVDAYFQPQEGSSPSNAQYYSPKNTIDISVDDYNQPTLDLSEDLLNEIAKIDEKQNIVVSSGLYLSGIRAQWFGVNYNGFMADQDTYVPICYIESNNLGKAQACFEIISREDSHGYYAKYMFSSRYVSATGNFSFLGCNLMLSPNGAQWFDDTSIVVLPVEEGAIVNGHRRSKYMIMKKVKYATRFSVDHYVYFPDFFIVNVLFEDAPNYSTVKWFTTVQGASDSHLNRFQEGNIGLTTYNDINIAANAVVATFNQ